MTLSTKLITFMIIISISIINRFAISSDDPEILISTSCSGNSTKESFQNYQMSVSSLLFDLTHETNPSIPGFYATSTRSSGGKAYGSYICWGDIAPELCQICVYNATQALVNQYFYEECFAFGDYLDSNLCLVHYANQSVIEYRKKYVLETGNIGGKVANYSGYNRTLSTTIEGLIEEAGYGNWTRTNLATRVVPVKGSQDEIHILVQCIPVISAENCSRCLKELYEFVPSSTSGTQGGFGVHADCIIKFSNRSFVGSGYGSLIPSYLYVYLVILVSLYLVFELD